MLRVDVAKKSIEAYERVIGHAEIEEIYSLANKLRNYRVVHVNATSFGGGVAEILHTLVPLTKSVGINTEWYTIEAPQEFFNVTKLFHNTLQGANTEIEEQQWETYEKYCQQNIEKIDFNADFVVIHDPQPAAMKQFLKKTQEKWIWRCHIDLSAPNVVVWERFSQYLKDYDKMIFHLKKYFPQDFAERCVAFPPSIDPLSEKNKDMSLEEARKIVSHHGIDPDRPLITVVARFDPWKDLFAAIDVYRIVKKTVKSVQLAIVSVMASDDPEGWVFFEKVARYAGTDPDIIFCTNLTNVGNLQVNAIQRVSSVALHTATKEGFGLVIAEALWKGIPVVARPVGGVKSQITHGKNGLLSWSVENLANYVLMLLRNPDMARKMGQAGRKLVKERFLITSNLKNYLRLFSALQR